MGVTLYVDTPVTALSVGLCAVKKARAVSPGTTRTERCCGTNVHGMDELVSALKCTVIWRAPGTGVMFLNFSSVAFCVVPP